MSRLARVTIVQFPHEQDDPHENLKDMQDEIRRHRSSDLIVFPELALHGHEVSYEHPVQMRKACRAVLASEIAELDRFVATQGARVVYGKLVERDGGLYNIAAFTDGTTRVSYAKTHVHWTESFTPGNEFPVVETPLGTMGMMICFDAAFPEVARILAIKGAKVVVNISAIPDHFPLKYVHRRMVGCSIYNQVYTVFANRAGEGYLGGSAVVDPHGEVLAVADDRQDALTVEVDMAQVETWRQTEPLLPNRRPGLYGDLGAQ